MDGRKRRWSKESVAQSLHPVQLRGRTLRTEAQLMKPVQAIEAGVPCK
jgi:hypothetical protein